MIFINFNEIGFNLLYNNNLEAVVRLCKLTKFIVIENSKLFFLKQFYHFSNLE